MKKNKSTAFLLAGMLAVSMLSACGSGTNTSVSSGSAVSETGSSAAAVAEISKFAENTTADQNNTITAIVSGDVKQSSLDTINTSESLPLQNRMTSVMTVQYILFISEKMLNFLMEPILTRTA